MSIFRLLRNYGAYEGWKVVGEDHATILLAVEAREAELYNSGGGEIIIVEVLPVTEAYRRADYEKTTAAWRKANCG